MVATAKVISRSKRSTRLADSKGDRAAQAQAEYRRRYAAAMSRARA